MRDHKLPLNRSSHQQLLEAGMGWVIQGLPDINKARDLALWYEEPATDLYLFSLLTRATRRAARHFLLEAEVTLDLDRIEIAGRQYPLPGFAKACHTFLHCYPDNDLTQASSSDTGTLPRQSRRQLLVELFLLEMLFDNRAAVPFQEFFDDSELLSEIDYHALTAYIDELLTPPQKTLPEREGLIALLKQPARFAPHSLSGQIRYIAQHWAKVLPPEMITELDVALAITEGERLDRQPGPGPLPIPRFGSGDGSDSPAAFTADSDWMSSAVLLAKSIYVWLDQLGSC